MKKMKKRILAGVLVTAMILACVPVSKAKAEDTHENHCLCQCGGDAESCHSGTNGHDVITNWTAWSNSTSLTNLESGKNYYLTTDVTLSATAANIIAWSSAKNVTLCLNGHKITFGTTHATEGRLFSMRAGQTISITDCKGTGMLVGSSGTGDGYCVTIGISSTSTGTFNLYGGTLTGTKTNTGSGYAGAVMVSYGTFNMYAGAISGNTSDVGAAVGIRKSGIFNMYGGTISGNVSSDYAGGVLVYSQLAGDTPTFNMYGGIIRENKTTSYYGGGVGLLCASVSGTRVGTPTANIMGGTITQNTSKTYGAGIGAQDASPVKISVSGGNITQNTAGGHGGGIDAYSGTLTLSGNAKIINNTALGVTGNVRISNTTVNFTELDENAQIGIYIRNQAPAANSGIAFATTDESGIPTGTVTCDLTNWVLDVDDDNNVSFLYADAEVVGHSITLAGDIGVNFYFREPAEEYTVLNSATAYLVFGGQIVETKECSGLAYTSTTIGSETYNCTVFSYPVSARQMDEDVTLILKDSLGVEFYRDTYCVNDYKEEASESGDANLITLTENMANYGAFANFHFDGEGQGGDAAGFDEITKDTFAQYKITQGTNMPEGITFYGLSLLTKSKTTLRVYFKLADATKINDYTFTYGDVSNQTLTLVDETNYAYFDIADITATDLDEMYTINCEGVDVVTCGALSYAYMYLSGNNPDVNVANVLKSLYQYHVAANAYAAAHSN